MGENSLRRPPLLWSTASLAGADGRVHVSERLLMLHDGPLIDQSLKGIAGTTIQDRPDRDRLAAQFEQFKRVA